MSLGAAGEATREEIMLALFAQLSTAVVPYGPHEGDFKWKSRSFATWQDDANEMRTRTPYFVQYEMDDVFFYNGERGLPPIRTYEVRVLVYDIIPSGQTMGVPDPARNSGASVLNPLLDGIEAALAPDPIDGVLTLGGLVIDCRIEGLIVKALGDHDPSGLVGAVIPIKILVQ